MPSCQVQPAFGKCSPGELALVSSKRQLAYWLRGDSGAETPGPSDSAALAGVGALVLPAAVGLMWGVKESS